MTVRINTLLSNVIIRTDFVVVPRLKGCTLERMVAGTVLLGEVCLAGFEVDGPCILVMSATRPSEFCWHHGRRFRLALCPRPHTCLQGQQPTPSLHVKGSEIGYGSAWSSRMPSDCRSMSGRIARERADLILSNCRCRLIMVCRGLPIGLCCNAEASCVIVGPNLISRCVGLQRSSDRRHC